MENIKLRYYQEQQIDFIERKLPGKLPMSIESPTGSGKTFVILEFCRRHFEKHKDEDFTIVITTGFNNLVYQFMKDCHKFDIDPVIWMGQAAAVDAVKYKEKYKKEPELSRDVQAFTQDPSLRIKEAWKYASQEQKSLYNQAKSKLKSFGPKLIITNHSSYLLGLKFGMFEPDICIVDESHTFGTFYELFLRTDISPKEIQIVQKYLLESGPTGAIFSRAISNNKQINPVLFQKVKENLQKTKIDNNLVIKFEDFATTKPSIDNFIEMNERGIKVTKFFSSFDVNQENICYILFSATQDSFTLDMFGVYKNRQYYERNCKSIDYTKSEFTVINGIDFPQRLDRFLSVCDEKGYKKGLILSTTLVDVRYMLEQEYLRGYKVYTKVKEFENSPKEEKSILIGSRALFQGVDTKGLEFVGINQIPFQAYDDKFKAQASYLQKVGRKNPWKEFTLPLVINDITQTTGRLWRSPDSKGLVSIFDDRLDDGNRFAYMKKYIEKARPGIKFTKYIFDKLKGNNK